jgi:hypothetical protein
MSNTSNETPVVQLTDDDIHRITIELRSGTCLLEALHAVSLTGVRVVIERGASPTALVAKHDDGSLIFQIPTSETVSYGAFVYGMHEAMHKLCDPLGEARA